MSDEDILIFLIKYSTNKEDGIRCLVSYLLEERVDNTNFQLKTYRTQALLYSEINRISNNDNVIGGFAAILALLISLINLFVGALNIGIFYVDVAAFVSGMIIGFILFIADWFTRKFSNLDYVYCWLNLVCESAEHNANKIEQILRG
jgi:hypothetical protein